MVLVLLATMSPCAIAQTAKPQARPVPPVRRHARVHNQLGSSAQYCQSHKILREQRMGSYATRGQSIRQRPPYIATQSSGLPAL